MSWYEEYENGVVKRIFRQKSNEVKVGWRKLYKQEVRDVYSSPSIIKMFKLKSIKCAGI
jgi:hypothetical protein